MNSLFISDKDRRVLEDLSTGRGYLISVYSPSNNNLYSAYYVQCESENLGKLDEIVKNNFVTDPISIPLVTENTPKSVIRYLEQFPAVIFKRRKTVVVIGEYKPIYDFTVDEYIRRLIIYARFNKLPVIEYLVTAKETAAQLI